MEPTGRHKSALTSEAVPATPEGRREEGRDTIGARCRPPGADPAQGELDALREEARRRFGLDLPLHDWAKEEGIGHEEMRERIGDAMNRKMAEKAANYGPEIMRMAEKSLLLQLLDQLWKEHLLQLDHLRQGINLRAYAQRDPLNEYKRESFNLFDEMLSRLRESVIGVLSHLEIRAEAPEEAMPQRTEQEMLEGRQDPAMAGLAGEYDEMAEMGDTMVATAPRPDRGPGGTGTVRHATGAIDPNDPSTWGKVPRNSPCPCGSGKKYKHCHGKV